VAEDIAFAQLIGADAISLGLSDFTLIGPPTQSRRRNLRATLTMVLERADREADLILLPIGVSTHPDHLLVREVLGGLLKKHGEHGAWVFYEDLPYAIHHPPRQADDILSSWGLRTKRLAVAGSWNEKRKLIDSYQSQLTQEIVRDLQQTKGCERIYVSHGSNCASDLSFLRALRIGSQQGYSVKKS
jgi:LmbE family N-acetylglucosaminyl deacetylase